MKDPMLAPVRLRDARPEDAALLAEIGAQSFREAFAAENTAENLAMFLEANFGAPQQSAELADRSSRFLIAEVDGQAAGYAKVSADTQLPGVNGSRPMELERLYALQRWIGHGVGAALMGRCLELAREGGHDCLCLGVWERNLRAQAFYRRWGFVEVCSHIFVVGTDPQTDLVMERAVT